MNLGFNEIVGKLGGGSQNCFGFLPSLCEFWCFSSHIGTGNLTEKNLLLACRRRVFRRWYTFSFPFGIFLLYVWCVDSFLYVWYVAFVGDSLTSPTLPTKFENVTQKTSIFRSYLLSEEFPSSFQSFFVHYARTCN